ncbi:recombinase family protein, partial [Streptomyces klenkii]
MSRAGDVAARRAEVARLAAEGNSGRAIAGRLCIGQGTVRRD